MTCYRIQYFLMSFWELNRTFYNCLIRFIFMHIVNYFLLKRPLLFRYLKWYDRRYSRCFHSSYKNYLSFLSTLRSSFRLIVIISDLGRHLSLVRDMISFEIFSFFLICNLNNFTLCYIWPSVRQKMMFRVDHIVKTWSRQVIDCGLSSTAKILIRGIIEFVMKAGLTL